MKNRKLGPKPRAKYIGEETTHPIEHAEDVNNVQRPDELLGIPPHEAPPDLRAEEPFGEVPGTPETD